MGLVASKLISDFEEKKRLIIYQFGFRKGKAI